jgi:hypothetical protein
VACLSSLSHINEGLARLPVNPNPNSQSLIQRRYSLWGEISIYIQGKSKNGLRNIRTDFPFVQNTVQFTSVSPDGTIGSTARRQEDDHATLRSEGSIAVTVLVNSKSKP